MVGVCALVKASGGQCEDVRIGLTHMGSTPLRALGGGGGVAGRSARRRADRGGGGAGGRGHRTPRRPERDTRLQAASRAHSSPAGRSSRRPAPDRHRRAIGLSEARGREPHRPGVGAETLASQGYLADEALAVAVFLATALEQPLLLEGEAGVGKTETAKALAAATGARLIRLQCHEGIDVSSALYDWDYPRQLLAIRAAEASGREAGALFRREFLIRRPLLEALEHDGPVVLLIDELDRADDEFEAFLLELLAEFQVTIPELGTIAARRAPDRDPDLEPDPRASRRAQAPLPLPLDRLPRSRPRGGDRPRPAAGRPRRRSPSASAPRSRSCAGEELYKLPGVGETISWARALIALDGPDDLDRTLGAALKVREDIERVREREVLEGV